MTTAAVFAVIAVTLVGYSLWKEEDRWAAASCGVSVISILVSIVT